MAMVTRRRPSFIVQTLVCALFSSPLSSYGWMPQIRSVTLARRHVGLLSAANRAAAELTTDEIQDKILEREAARSRRDFHNADLSLKKLNDIGIVVITGPDVITWTAPDGRSGSAPAGTAPQARSCRLTTGEIESRVREYEQARKNRAFDECNKLRDNLFRDGVTVNQKANLWKTSDGRKGDLWRR